MSDFFSIHVLFHPGITAIIGANDVLRHLFPFHIGFLSILLEIISRDADIWQHRNVEGIWQSSNKHSSRASKSCQDLIFVFHLASCTARNISNWFVLEKLYEVVAVQTVTMANKTRRALRNDYKPGKRGDPENSTWTQGRQLSGICRNIDLEPKSSMLCSSIEKTSNPVLSFVPITKADSDFPAVPVQTFVGSSILLGRTCTVSNGLRLRKNIRTCGIA
jgi:hypothetical protein